MHPEVTLISQSIPDWQRFVHGVNATIGRSPTVSLDAAGMSVGSSGSYISALGEMQKEDSHPIRVLQDCDDLLEHLSYSFFVSSDREVLFQLLLLTRRIHVMMTDCGKNRENFIASGTLKDWRDLIVNNCIRESDFEIRLFAAMIYDVLDKIGFREIFGRYQRKALADRTFILEGRR